MLDVPHLRQMRAGDDERMRATEFFRGFAELLRSAAADDDVLGDGKMERLHLGGDSFLGN